jgi:hypothetical protein
MTLEYQTSYVDVHRLINECLIMIRRGVAPNGSLYQALVLEVGYRCRPSNPNFVSCEKHMNIYSVLWFHSISVSWGLLCRAP